MTYPYGTDPLEGLDATPAERLAYLRALDEVDAEEAAGGPEPEPDPYGWDSFNAATAQMDAAHQRDAQRLAQDVADQIPDRRPPTDEVKLQRAMDRIQAGTYTAPRGQQPARDAYGRFAAACGPLDDATGQCGARYHAADCGAVVAGTAAVESVKSAEAWNRTLAAHTPPPEALGYAAEFAGPSDPLGGADTWADLLTSGGPDPATVHERMLAVLDGEQAAEPGPGPIPPEQMPDVAGLRSAMGI